MQPLVECVPNFSEGRRPEVIEAIVAAIQGAAPVHVLDYSSDTDHNRSVVTFVGAPQDVDAAAFAAVAKAAELINLDAHQGEHPRIGATDVFPFVPVRGIALQECADIARRVGQRVAEALNIPVYLYEAAATRPDRVNLANIRKGGYEGLREAIRTDPDRAPDFGPAEMGPAGATVIGARPFLIAYNVYLNTGDVRIAKEIARAVRHSSGGLRYVKALGLLVDGRAQVSMNLTNFRKTPVYRVVECIRREAARHGAAITDSELIGLIPQDALIDSAQWYLQLDNLTPEHIIENRLAVLQAEGAAHPSAFLDAVAEGTPTPGGGAVAALCGALSASLVTMVARLTVGKSRYADVESEMKAVADEADRLRAALAQAIDDDVEAFAAVMDAYRLDQDAPKRGERIQTALIAAARVPHQVMQLAVDSLKLCQTAAEMGSKNAATDAGVAAHAALAAVEGAWLNVRVNLTGLANAALAKQVREDACALAQDARTLHEQIIASVEARAGIG